MASIEQYLSKIKSAVYGRDVRNSIHDSIKAINDEKIEAVSTSIEKAEEATAKADEATSKASEAAVYAANAVAAANRAESAAANISVPITQESGESTSQVMSQAAVTEALGGKADLDSNGRIPYSQLPESAMEFKGTWNASTNTPELVDGEGDHGDFYIVSANGTFLGVEYKQNDRIINNHGTWTRLSSGEATTNGHAIENSVGSALTQTETLKFADMDVSNSNGKTVIEAIKKVTAQEYEEAPDGIYIIEDEQITPNPRIYKVRDSMATATKTISSGIFRTDSLIDIYYDEDYDIDPTYELQNGSFTITLEEAPEDTIYFTLKVVN